MNKRTVYLAGRITGDENYKSKFARAAEALTKAGMIVVNPAMLPGDGFSYEAYISMSSAMLDECAEVCFLSDWTESRGAMYEYGRAAAKGKRVFFFDEFETCFTETDAEQIQPPCPQKAKTYRQDFMEKHPNCLLGEDVPAACRENIYGKAECEHGCYDCWNEPMPEEQK